MTVKTSLNVSAVLPESAVLVGFVPLSKLNALGLSECGEAVVELALIHSLDSESWFWIAADVELEAPVPAPELLLLPPPPPPLPPPLLPLPPTPLLSDIVVCGFTWPNAMAIGLGELSGEDVNEDTCLDEINTAHTQK